MQIGYRDENQYNAVPYGYGGFRGSNESNPVNNYRPEVISTVKIADQDESQSNNQQYTPVIVSKNRYSEANLKNLFGSRRYSADDGKNNNTPIVIRPINGEVRRTQGSIVKPPLAPQEKIQISPNLPSANRNLIQEQRNLNNNRISLKKQVQYERKSIDKIFERDDDDEDEYESVSNQIKILPAKPLFQNMAPPVEKNSEMNSGPISIKSLKNNNQGVLGSPNRVIEFPLKYAQGNNGLTNQITSNSRSRSYNLNPVSFDDQKYPGNVWETRKNTVPNLTAENGTTPQPSFRVVEGNRMVFSPVYNKMPDNNSNNSNQHNSNNIGGSPWKNMKEKENFDEKNEYLSTGLLRPNTDETAKTIEIEDSAEKTNLTAPIAADRNNVIFKVEPELSKAVETIRSERRQSNYKPLTREISNARGASTGAKSSDMPQWYGYLKQNSLISPNIASYLKKLPQNIENQDESAPKCEFQNQSPHSAGGYKPKNNFQQFNVEPNNQTTQPLSIRIDSKPNQQNTEEKSSPHENVISTKPLSPVMNHNIKPLGDGSTNQIPPTQPFLDEKKQLMKENFELRIKNGQQKQKIIDLEQKIEVLMKSGHNTRIDDFCDEKIGTAGYLKHVSGEIKKEALKLQEIEFNVLEGLSRISENLEDSITNAPNLSKTNAVLKEFKLLNSNVLNLLSDQKIIIEKASKVDEAINSDRFEEILKFLNDKGASDHTQKQGIQNNWDNSDIKKVDQFIWTEWKKVFATEEESEAKKKDNQLQDTDKKGNSPEKNSKDMLSAVRCLTKGITFEMPKVDEPNQFKWVDNQVKTSQKNKLSPKFVAEIDDSSHQNSNVQNSSATPNFKIKNNNHNSFFDGPMVEKVTKVLGFDFSMQNEESDWVNDRRDKKDAVANNTFMKNNTFMNKIDKSAIKITANNLAFESIRDSEANEKFENIKINNPYSDKIESSDYNDYYRVDPTVKAQNSFLFEEEKKEAKGKKIEELSDVVEVYGDGMYYPPEFKNFGPVQGWVSKLIEYNPNKINSMMNSKVYDDKNKPKATSSSSEKVNAMKEQIQLLIDQNNILKKQNEQGKAKKKEPASNSKNKSKNGAQIIITPPKNDQIAEGKSPSLKNDFKSINYMGERPSKLNMYDIEFAKTYEDVQANQNPAQKEPRRRASHNEKGINGSLYDVDPSVLSENYLSSLTGKFGNSGLFENKSRIDPKKIEIGLEKISSTNPFLKKNKEKSNKDIIKDRKNSTDTAQDDCLLGKGVEHTIYFNNKNDDDSEDDIFQKYHEEEEKKQKDINENFESIINTVYEKSNNEFLSQNFAGKSEIHSNSKDTGSYFKTENDKKNQNMINFSFINTDYKEKDCNEGTIHTSNYGIVSAKTAYNTDRSNTDTNDNNIPQRLVSKFNVDDLETDRPATEREGQSDYGEKAYQNKEKENIKDKYGMIPKGKKENRSNSPIESKDVSPKYTKPEKNNIIKGFKVTKEFLDPLANQIKKKGSSKNGENMPRKRSLERKGVESEKMGSKETIEILKALRSQINSTSNEKEKIKQLIIGRNDEIEELKIEIDELREYLEKILQANEKLRTNIKVKEKDLWKMVSILKSNEKEKKSLNTTIEKLEQLLWTK